MNDEIKLKPKDIVYYARILPNVGIYEVCELKVRCVEEEWFSAVEKGTKRAYLFQNGEISRKIFKNRLEALNLVIDSEFENKKRIFEKDNDIYE